MKKAICFTIKNIQEDYAKCLQFMQYYNLEKNKKLGSDIHVKHIEYDIEGDSYKTVCEIEEKYSSKQYLTGSERAESILWYFRIHMGQEDDIVNLMHFYLIRQKYENALAVLITPDFVYDMKISAYLSFEMKKDRNTVFLKTQADKIQMYGNVHRLPSASLKERN